MNGQYLTTNLNLQTPTFDFKKGEPWLFIVVPIQQSAWTEEDFIPNAAYVPPF